MKVTLLTVYRLHFSEMIPYLPWRITPDNRERTLDPLRKTTIDIGLSWQNSMNQSPYSSLHQLLRVPVSSTQFNLTINKLLSSVRRGDETSIDNIIKAHTLPTYPTAAMTRLLDMPILRPIDLREGQTIDWARPRHHEAILGFTRGISIPANQDCRCYVREGVFTECIIVPSEFRGSCTNCHYLGEGAFCPLRQRKYTFYTAFKSVKLC